MYDYTIYQLALSQRPTINTQFYLMIAFDTICIIYKDTLNPPIIILNQIQTLHCLHESQAAASPPSVV